MAFNPPIVPAIETVCNALPKSKDLSTKAPVTGSYLPKPGNIAQATLDPNSPASNLNLSKRLAVCISPNALTSDCK